MTPEEEFEQYKNELLLRQSKPYCVLDARTYPYVRDPSEIDKETIPPGDN